MIDNLEIDEILTALTRKKIGWIMEILELSNSSQDTKQRIKKAVWNLKEEIKESINQEKKNHDKRQF
jgi:hypothetical protein